MYILQKSSKIFPMCQKNMLSRPFWHLAETKILAGLSQVKGPAELIEMAQYPMRQGRTVISESEDYIKIS